MNRFYNYHQTRILIILLILIAVLTLILKYITFHTEVLKTRDSDRNVKRFIEEYNYNALKYSNARDQLLTQGSQFKGERVVHIDLKGAPPMISYFKELFPVLSMLHVTSLLIEYEDMFPYDDKNIAAKNAYTKHDIKTLLKMAENNKLNVIPLVQTFGHLEFVLKSVHFKHLREVIKYPQSICPSQNETFSVLTSLIDNIMNMHPNIRYIHIGCDEVYQLGMCELCTKQIIDHHWSVKELFLNHVSAVARYIRARYPKVTPLIWDDELQSVSKLDLQKFEMGKLVEPVVWSYHPIIDTPEDVWEKYADIFPAVWVASSFKGSTGPNQILPDISYHLENNFAWMQLINKYSYMVNFKGIILTGWQRYDHFATLCELLPASIPSLVSNLLLITGNANLDNIDVPKEIEQIVVCGTNYKYSYLCNFPGIRLYNTIVDFYNINNDVETLFNGSCYHGWMTEYNIKFSFSTPSLIEEFSYKLSECFTKLQSISQMLHSALSEVYDDHTVNEWLETVFQPLYKKMESANEAAERLLNCTDWPQRPLS